jgi:hypothetical protein
MALGLIQPTLVPQKNRVYTARTNCARITFPLFPYGRWCEAPDARKRKIGESTGKGM